jgi:hypothetical protein
MRTAETAKGHRHYSTALGSQWTTMAAESGRVHARLVTSTNSMRHAIFTNHRTKLLRARSHERLYGPLLRRENERLASWPAGPRRSARHCPRGHDAVTATGHGRRACDDTTMCDTASRKADAPRGAEQSPQIPVHEAAVQRTTAAAARRPTTGPPPPPMASSAYAVHAFFTRSKQAHLDWSCENEAAALNGGAPKRGPESFPNT